MVLHSFGSYLIVNYMKKTLVKSVFALAMMIVIGAGSFGSVYGYGGSSSGTRVKPKAPVATPAPQVLGAATTTPATACTGMYLNDYMRKGMANNSEQVMKLQTFLSEQGFFTMAPTGYFGDITEAAVKAFQAKYAADILTPWGETQPTGYVFKTTRAKINNIKCPGSEPTPTV
jgi:peptidoglycan hydrolase-like protein with peptidoglycan-binding domain